MKFTRNSLMALACASWALCTAPGAFAQPLTVAAGSGIPKVWRADQHLYVKGRLGPSEAQLAALEKWLDANARNWTVALLQSASAERFVDAGGQSYSGMDAVEHALGKSLSNTEAFRELKHAETGQENGAVFVLYLQERKMAYFASETYAARNLGDNRWQGNLDRPAIQALRNGGRVIDAVKNTISNIDKRLAVNLAAAKAAKAKAEQDRLRKIAEDKAKAEMLAVERELKRKQDLARVGSLRRRLGQVEVEIGAFRKKWNDPGGDLATPNIGEITVLIDDAETKLNRSSDPRASQTLAGVDKRLRQIQAALLKHAEDEKKIQGLGARIEEASKVSDLEAGGDHRELIVDAGAFLEQARTLHSYAESRYAGNLRSAETSLEEAAMARSYFEDDLARKAKMEWLKSRLIQAAYIVAAVVFLLVLFLLNRARRPEMERVVELLGNWRKAMRDKTEGLFELQDRAFMQVGSAADLDERDWTGETLRISRVVIKDVDELFIMSACVDRVIRDAELLVRPAGAVARLSNLFFAGRYRRATRLLKDEPIRFAPEERLELTIQGKQAPRNKLLSRQSDFKAFSLSFEELIDVFHQRAEEALVNLEILETSWGDIAERLNSLSGMLSQCEAKRASIREAFDSDGYFELDDVFEILLGAAQQSLNEAEELGFKDPVAALAGCAALAGRRGEDAELLIDSVAAFRSDKMENFGGRAAELEAANHKTSWIAEALLQLSTRVDELAKQAVDTALDAEGKCFADDLSALANRVDEAERLAVFRGETQRAALDERRGMVASTRASLAAAHSFPESSVLRETDFDPDVWLDKGEELYASSGMSLDLGETTAAAKELQEIADIAAMVDALLAEVEGLCGALQGRASAARERAAALTSELARHTEILNGLRTDFSAEALVIQAGDPAYPEAGESVDRHDAQASQYLRDAEWEIDAGVEAFVAAKVMEADARLNRAVAAMETAEDKLQQIREQKDRLTRVARENESRLEACRKQLADLKPSIYDARTMKATLRMAQEDGEALDAASERASVHPANPFVASALLDDVEIRLNGLDGRIQADWRLHQDAAETLLDVKAQMRVFNALLTTTQTDDIPDSRAIKKVSGEAGRIDAELARLAERLEAPNEDWEQLDREFESFNENIMRKASVLRNELERGQRCIALLREAMNEVRSARNWSGPFGVDVSDKVGRHALREAREELAKGDYEDAEEECQSAIREARKAVQKAESLVRSRRRRQERREAEERRRRERDRRRARRRERALKSSSRSSRSYSSSSFSGFSGFGGGSSGGSSFSSGSGFSGGSSFSSGSGFSRSGW